MHSCFAHCQVPVKLPQILVPAPFKAWFLMITVSLLQGQWYMDFPAKICRNKFGRPLTLREGSCWKDSQ